MSSKSTGTPLPIKLSQLRRFDGQPRKNFSQKSIISLAQSLRGGQETPVSVIKSNAQSGIFILIDGERRMRAFQVIAHETGTDPIILAFVDVVKDIEDHFRKSTIANLHREDMSPLDVGSAFARLKKTMSEPEIVEMAGKSISYVRNYISLDGLPTNVKEMMDPDRSKDELLGVSQAIEIARVPNETLQFELAKEAVARRLSVVEKIASQIESPRESAGTKKFSKISLVSSN